MPSSNTQAIANLSDKIPNIPYFGKMLREDGINKDISSSINVSDLSKYTVFAADLVSNWAGGAMFGLRLNATTIRFFGTSLASGGVLTHSILIMKVSGDNITGWESGTYETKWGDSVSGIRNLRGIC